MHDSSEKEKGPAVSDGAHAGEAVGLQWEDMPVCPICGSAERRHTNRFAVDMDHYYVRCLGCDVAYLAPRPIYDENYLERYECIDEGKYTKERRWHYRNQELLDQIEQFMPQNGSLLDVGCYTGEMLLAAQERGWRVAGVDISSTRISVCQSKGLDVTHQDITTSTHTGTPFDVITACHVLEHTVDPLAFLSAVRDRLSDSGLVVIEVPNLLGWEQSFKDWLARLGLRRYHLSGGAHYFDFTYKAFCHLADKVGLRIIACYTYGHKPRRPALLAWVCREFLKRFLVGSKFRFFLKKRSG